MDISYSTRVSNSSGTDGISVISKRKLAVKEDTHAKLKEKFDRIESARLLQESQKEKEKTTVENSKVVLITHFNVFLYSTCFFIQTGVLPYLTKQLGADPVTFGKLQTAFSVCQLVGGPLYGRMGDLIGERSALLLAFSSTVLTYILTGLAYSLPVLFLSRLPSIFMHVMQGSQMVVASLSGEVDRAGALARLGVSYGLGMVLGPSIGGAVATHLGEQAAAFVAAAGSCVSLLIVFALTPNVKKPTADKNVFNLTEILRLLWIPEARSLLIIKTVSGIPIGILQSMFSVIAMEQFQLPADQNGLLMSYIGVLSLIMQGVGVSLITSRLSDVSAIRFSAVTLAISYYALCLIRGLTDFLVLLVPMVFSLCLVNSIISATLTKVVPTEKTGTMLGLNMAVNSIIRALAPTVGGWLLAVYGFSSIGLLGVACNSAILVLLMFLQI